MTSPLAVRAIELYRAELSLAEPFRHASSGLVDALSEVVVRIETANGLAGHGEVRGNAHYVTGDTPGRILAVLADLLAPALLGADLAAPAPVLRRLDALVPGNTAAKAALDIAIHDLRARSLGLPLAALLGGPAGAEVKVHATIAFCPPEEAAAQASARAAEGFRTLKVRVGLRPFARDLARIKAVRAALDSLPDGQEVRLAVDANQGWSAKEAVAALRRLERFDLAWAEQPVPAADIAALAEVRAAAPMPVVADESCAGPAELLELVGARAVDGVHLKLIKAGGIRPLMAMVAIAEAAALPYMLGQMDEGMLASAAGLHCAAAAAPFSCELYGFRRVARQPFSGLVMRDGAIALPDAPGLGIAVDAAGLVPVARIAA